MMLSQNAVPPDGGWGWVFVAGCSLQFFFHGGLIRTFSLIYERMLVHFGASASATAAVYSFHIASALLTAPLSAALSTRVTPRQGALIGTTLMFTGMLATAFAPNIVVVYFTYGIMAGTGGGMISIMRFVTAPQWFRKNLGRAMSLILMSDALGMMALSPLLDFLFGYYGYTGTMMFISALSLHGLVLAAVMVPIRYTHPQKPKLELEVNGDSVLGQDADNKDEELGEKSPQLPMSRTLSLSSSEGEKEQWAVSFKDGIRRSKSNCSISKSTTKISTENDAEEQLATMNHISSSSSSSSSEDSDKDSTVQNGRHQQVVIKGECKSFNFQNGGNHSRVEQALSGSSPDCDGCLSKFYGYLDVRLLGSSHFLTFTLLMTSSSLCSSMSNTHMAGMAMDRSVASHQVAILLAIIGATSVVAKLCSGFLFDVPCIKAVRTLVFGAMGAITGLFLIFVPVTSGALMFASMWIPYQVLISSLNTQESVILNDLIPRKSYASAVGLSRFFRGLGVMVGPTVGGYLKDTTGNYSSTLYFGGSVFLLGSIVFASTMIHRHLRIHKKTIEI